ncbi:MAG TPA: hypothetical protein VKV95_18525 [Terriglobia bacterium]|nr:hypothetical protein [Terriglobia bacterium]
MRKFGWLKPKVQIFAGFLWTVTAGVCVFPAASGPTLPKADELVEKFVARSHQEERENLDDKYGYIERRLHDELDKNGTVREHSDETFQIVLLENHSFPRLIAKDGKPLVADEQRKQAEREKKFLDEQHKKAAGPAKDDRDSLKLDKQFLGHFRFDVVGQEDLNGRPSYVITVIPRAGDLPVRNNSEKIITHMQGKVWVDEQDYSLVKCDLHLTEPTSFYGILGSVRQVDLLLQRRWVESKVWMMENLIFAIDARKLFTPIRVRQHSEFSDFKKLAN